MNSFVTTQGMQFMLNGKPFYWGGANNYYLFYADQRDVDAVFRDAAALRIPVIRTWAFSDGESGIASSNAQNNGRKVWFQELVNGRIEFNDSTETGLGRLDYVLEAAKKHGVKLIMTLTNNWNDFGGADWYVDRIGEGTKSHSSFFSNEAIKQQYKNYVRHIMNRVNSISNVKYGDDPTILGWELINEARCVGSQKDGRFQRDSSCGTSTLTRWVDEMSTFIKSINTKQLVGVGAEGFFNNRPQIKTAFTSITDGSEGYDFDETAALKNVDMLDLHSYMMHWGVERDPDFTDATLQWIQMHADVARRVNKPIYLGEYGVLKKEQRETSLMQFQKASVDSGYGGTAIWMLCSDYQNGKYPNFDGFCMYRDDGDINKVLVEHNNIMIAKSVQ
jgi:mannan endo-1,4-beta-mannosidase